MRVKIMRDDIRQILNLTRLPGRLTAEQAAPMLGVNAHEIPILVKAKLLKPLGAPLPNAVKYFSCVEVEACGRDEKWLSRATQAIYQHWAAANKKRVGRPQLEKTVATAA